MLDKLRRMMGVASDDSNSQEAFQQLNKVAPLKSSPKEDADTEGHAAASFICREAVLDRSERIAGYEFALGRELQARMLEKSALIRRVYDDAMLRNLAPLGVSSLLGDRFAYIRISVASLRNPLLKAYANMNAVIMITPGSIDESEMDSARKSLAYLGALGIKVGWTLSRPRPELAEFLQAADMIEVETSALDGIQLKTMSAELRSGKSRQKLIASDVQTSDDFSLCYQCGFDYFMGPFVSSRENWHPPKSEINRMRVFQTLNMIRSGEEFDAIADYLRIDPILTFKLLRYINSAGIGLQQKINDISQALLVLGRDRFYRWLSLLVFDFSQTGYRERILNEQALTRARFMEMLAGKGSIPASADQLFLTGLFSLLEVMMEQPLEEVLRQISLPDSVASALRGEDGLMRDALLLGIAMENADTDLMENTANKCGLEAGDVIALMLEALAWSQKIVSANE